LLRDYPEHHPVVLYEAAALPGELPRVERSALHELARANVSGISTLYVPPGRVAEPDRELQAALEALRVQHTNLQRAPVIHRRRVYEEEDA
jgi:hypothetical protein